MNPEIRIEDITRVYSGKPGCGCGCRGTYWPKYSEAATANDARQIKRIVGIMNARIDEVKAKDGVYFIEDDARYFWAFTKDAK